MEPIVVRGKELARLLGISLVSVRRMDSAGLLPKAIRLGGCVGWRVDEIKDWLQAGSPDRVRWIAIQAASKKGGR